MSRLLYPTLPVIQPNKMSASIVRTNLFQAILNTTNSPALALQELLYYKCLPYSTNSTKYKAQFALSALQPVRSIGFFIVLATLILHVTCVMFITRYLHGIASSHRPSYYTSIGNVWQVYALQLSPGIEEILRDPAGRLE